MKLSIQFPMYKLSNAPSLSTLSLRRIAVNAWRHATRRQGMKRKRRT